MKINHIRIMTVLMVVALVQLSCSTKVVENALCWNTGGQWICDDENCVTGHCDRSESAKVVGEDPLDAPVSDEERQCWLAGRLWVCDDENCATGHCEDLAPLTGEARQCFDEGGVWILDPPDYTTGHCEEREYATEAPVQEEPPTEAPIEEGIEPEELPEIDVGDPIDDCDARKLVMIHSYLLFDTIEADGTRWCEERVTIFNLTNQYLIFTKHLVIHDDRYPEDGPKWSNNLISPGGFREQELGYHDLSPYNDDINSWYVDRMAVVYPSCFDGYEAWEIPDEWLEPYAFDVPHFCTP